jgi:hypothetical protein
MFENLVEKVALRVEEALASFAATGDIPVPLTNAGKINITQLVTQWQLGGSGVRQHMYRAEILALLNPACETFGVGGIRTGEEAGDADSRIRELAVRSEQQARKSDRATVEAKSEVVGLLTRIRELEQGRREDRMTISRLEAQLDLVRRGVVLPS